MNKNQLLNMIQLQKNNKSVGIYSACTANELVIKACMEKALETNTILMIESTANQVNQFGGYTGMTPLDFKNFIIQIANDTGLPMNRIILGGDHLGPLTWTHLNEKEAMENAKELIFQYVMAGFTKIHVDTSMRVQDDFTDIPLSTEVIARRGAQLVKVAQGAYTQLLKKNPNAIHPVYIVGSEVPIPGGATEEEEQLQVTQVDDFHATVKTFKSAFKEHNIEDCWKNVIGVVVQPGVEFSDITIHEYQQDAAKELTCSLQQYPTLVLEGHSTDYQTKEALRKMVEDGIAILKVGPGLTFCFREGLFALSHIEDQLISNSSHFIDVLEKVMLQNPTQWKNHYHGTEAEMKLKRQYSYSDRCRYYLPESEVQVCLQKMLNNLKGVDIPLSLLSAYMPVQYNKVRHHKLSLDPEELLKDFVKNCCDDYLYATQQQNLN